MSISPKIFFGLHDNYTITDLQNSYLKKKQEIISNQQLSDIDKQFWIENLYKLYVKGEQESYINNNQTNALLNNLNNQINMHHNQTNALFNDLNNQITMQNNHINQQQYNINQQHYNINQHRYNINQHRYNINQHRDNINQHRDNINQQRDRDNINQQRDRDNINQHQDNINQTGYCKSYQSFTNNDGTTYVSESSKIIDNNKVKSKNVSYKIDKYGNKIYDI